MNGGKGGKRGAPRDVKKKKKKVGREQGFCNGGWTRVNTLRLTRLTYILHTTTYYILQIRPFLSVPAATQNSRGRSHGTLCFESSNYCHFLSLLKKKKNSWTPRYRIRSVRSMLYKGAPSTVPDCGELCGVRSRSRIAALTNFFEFEPRSACLDKTPPFPQSHLLLSCALYQLLCSSTPPIPSQEATAKV